jgi:hypothetical protein
VNPGAANNYEEVICLWHGTASPCLNDWGDPDSDEQALDWQNSQGSGVYYRTWAYKSNGLGLAYNAWKYTNDSSCRRVKVEMYDSNGTYRGGAYYTHTLLAGSFIYGGIYGDNPYIFSWYHIGTTASLAQEKVGCVTEAPHLHQASEIMWGNPGYNNLQVYGHTSSPDYWHHYRSWTQ